MPRNSQGLMNLYAMYFSKPISDGVCTGYAEVAANHFVAGGAKGAAFMLFREIDLFIAKSIDKSQDPGPLLALIAAAKLKNIEEKSAGVEMKLSDREQKALMVPAYLEGIAVFLEPFLFEEALGRFIPQKEWQEVSVLTQSEEFKAVGGRKSFLDFPGMFPKKEDLILFKEFAMQVAARAPCNLVFSLGSHDHRIKLLYDKTMSAWLLIDANNPILIISPSEIDTVIYNAFKFDKPIDLGTAFQTTLSAAGNETEKTEFKQFREDIQKLPVYLKLKEVTREKAQHVIGGENISLIHIAAISDNFEVVPLIAAESKGGLILADHLNRTAITYAIGSHALKFLETFFAVAGPEANKIINLGVMPLQGRNLTYAMIYGFYDIAKLLLENGANPNLTDTLGTTPLIAAINRNDPNLVLLLFNTRTNYKLNPNLPLLTGPDEGKTAAHFAVVARNFDTLKILVRRARTLDLTIRDKEGNTPLDLASDKAGQTPAERKENKKMRYFLRKAQEHNGMISRINQFLHEIKATDTPPLIYSQIDRALKKMKHYIQKYKGRSHMLLKMLNNIPYFIDNEHGDPTNTRLLTKILLNLINDLPNKKFADLNYLYKEACHELAPPSHIPVPVKRAGLFPPVAPSAATSPAPAPASITDERGTSFPKIEAKKEAKPKKPPSVTGPKQ